MNKALSPSLSLWMKFQFLQSSLWSRWRRKDKRNEFFVDDKTFLLLQRPGNIINNTFRFFCFEEKAPRLLGLSSGNSFSNVLIILFLFFLFSISHEMAWSLLLGVCQCSWHSVQRFFLTRFHFRGTHSLFSFFNSLLI